MSLFHAGITPALDSNGSPISGATWTFYRKGTLTTVPVYADSGLTTSLGSSEEADAAGRFVDIYLDDSIQTRAILRDAGGTTIKDIDPINGTAGLSAVAPTGGSDDGQAITDVFAALREDTGAGTVELSRGQTYTLSDLADQTVGSEAVHGSGRSYLPPGCTLHGNGAKLKAATAFSFPLIRSTFETLSTHIVTGPMTSGETVFQLATVGEATQFAVGDTVLWRLGDFSYDAPETPNWSFAYVVAVDTGTGEVTLDRGLSLPWDGTGTNNKHLRRVLPFAGKMVEDISFEGLSAAITDHVSRGISVHGGWGVQLDNLRGRWCGATFSLQYCQDFHIGYAEARNNNSTGGPSNVYGRGISMAESRGRIDHLAVFDCNRYGAYIEAASELAIGFFHDVVVNDSNVANERHRGFYVTGNSRVHVERSLFEGAANYLCYEEANGGKVSFGTVRCVSYAAASTYPVPGYNCERLELNIDGTEELYIGGLAKWHEQTIYLTDSMTDAVFDFAPGCVVACDIFFGGGAVRADFTAFRVGRPSATVALTGELVPETPSSDWIDFITAYSYGSHVALAKPRFGGSNTALWQYRAEKARVRLSTASSGVTGSGKYIRVRMLIVPNDLAAVDTATTAQIAREQTDVVYEATETKDWADLATATQQTEGVTVTGAALGDLVNVSMSVALSGTRLWGEVTATDTVTVYHRNDTGSNVNVGSGTLSVQVRKRRGGV